VSTPTPVIFDDGSKALVPPGKLSDALKDGGKVAQAMHFDDGSKAYVTLDRVHDAIHDGGQLMGIAPQLPVPAMEKSPLSPTEQVGAHLAGKVASMATHAADAGKGLADDVYDVSTPNIATQLYRHAQGLPNTLNKIPLKAVTAFFTAAGLPESELAEAAPAAEAASKAAPAAADAAPAAAKVAETAEAKTPSTSVNLDAPRTLSGEAALRQVLTGQDTDNLMKIAKSRGINVTQESQLRSGIAGPKLINKIIDDFSDDELDNLRSTYIENTRMGKHDFGEIGPEAWKTMGLQTYFPDVKIPQAQLDRVAKSIAKSGANRAVSATPAPGDDLSGILQESLKHAVAKKTLANLAGGAP
jgi:hypothetical protein